MIIKRLLKWILMTTGALTLLILLGLYLLFSQLKSGDNYFPLPHKKPLKPTSVLTLKIGKTSFSEGPTDRSLVTSFSSLFLPKKRSLYDFTHSIFKACHDPFIKGILVEIDGNALSTSQAQELRSALKDFKTSGKFVYAFARTFGEGGNGTVPYYVCTVADKIWLQPRGDLNLVGYNLESYFLKNIFDTYRIIPRFGRREGYKTLIETYTGSQFTKESRENLQALLSDIHTQVTKDIAIDRKLTTDSVISFINDGPYLDHEALSQGYVDHLGYKDELKEELSKKSAAPIHYVTVSDYKHHYTNQPRDSAPLKIGVVVVDGAIMYGKQSVMDQGASSPSKIIHHLQKAANDPSIRAIVLRINSPGGTVTGAEGIWHEVSKIARSPKPIVVSMGAVAASAGYMIAAPATKIVATPATLTGSIGVATGKISIGKALDHFGIQSDHIKTSKNANLWSLNQDFTEEQWAKIEKQLDYYYADFMEKVSKGRGLKPDIVRALAQGQVWSGAQAKEKGLVDELGDFNTALTVAKNLITPSGKSPDNSHANAESSPNDIEVVFMDSPSSLWEDFGEYGFFKESLSTALLFSDLLKSPALQSFLLSIGGKNGPLSSRLPFNVDSH